MEEALQIKGRRRRKNREKDKMDEEVRTFKQIKRDWGEGEETFQEENKRKVEIDFKES